MNDVLNIILNSKYLVFLGGAGVSTASGISDFRSKNGLNNQKQTIPVEEILSHHFFVEQPQKFYEFYKKNMVNLKALPNVCHKTLADLEKKGILKCIITQNIDGLHTKAGSQKVLELHGSIYKNHCLKCGKYYNIEPILNNDIPYCECGGIIKPDVVLYEEPLEDITLEMSILSIKKADTLIVCGTSLNVYPANTLLNYFNGKNLIIINKDKTPYDYKASIVLHEDLSKVFKLLKEELDDKI